MAKDVPNLPSTPAKPATPPDAAVAPAAPVELAPKMISVPAEEWELMKSQLKQLAVQQHAIVQQVGPPPERARSMATLEAKKTASGSSPSVSSTRQPMNHLVPSASRTMLCGAVQKVRPSVGVEMPRIGRRDVPGRTAVWQQ